MSEYLPNFCVLNSHRAKYSFGSHRGKVCLKEKKCQETMVTGKPREGVHI